VALNLITRSYRRVLVSTLLHASVHNLLNVLVQIANKMGLQKKRTEEWCFLGGPRRNSISRAS
jgi:hypothetical protein